MLSTTSLLTSSQVITEMENVCIAQKKKDDMYYIKYSTHFFWILLYPPPSLPPQSKMSRALSLPQFSPDIHIIIFLSPYFFPSFILFLFSIISKDVASHYYSLLSAEPFFILYDLFLYCMGVQERHLCQNYVSFIWIIQLKYTRKVAKILLVFWNLISPIIWISFSVRCAPFGK